MPNVIETHSTRLGTIWSEWSEQGLYRVRWDEPATSECSDVEVSAEQRQSIDEFGQRLGEYCETGKGSFRDIKIDASGFSEFTQRVYKCCRDIEAGQTLTYKQLATIAGSQRASRAVGAAMARNRVLLVIPCHRVIASDGQLRGFSAPGGLQTKQMLLDLEAGVSGQALFSAT